MIGKFSINVFDELKVGEYFIYYTYFDDSLNFESRCEYFTIPTFPWMKWWMGHVMTEHGLEGRPCCIVCDEDDEIPCDHVFSREDIVIMDVFCTRTYRWDPVK